MWNAINQAARAAERALADSQAAAGGGAPTQGGAQGQSSRTPGWDDFRSRVSTGARMAAQQAGTGPGAPPAAGGLATLVRDIGSSMVDALDRKMKQAHLPLADAADIQLGLETIWLTELAYLPTAQELSAAMEGTYVRLVHFHEQQGTGEGALPQWYLARGALPAAPGEDALFLVFRGTASRDDVTRDLMAQPESRSRVSIHAGFLSGVCEDDQLAALLGRQLAQAPNLHLYLLGHSLGGALALTVSPPSRSP